MIYNFSGFSDENRDDKNFVLSIVGQCGHSLIYASNRLKDDKDIVLEAVKENAFSLKYASDRLQSDILLLFFLKKYHEKRNYLGNIFDNYIINDLNWYEERMQALDILLEEERMLKDIKNNRAPSIKKIQKFWG